MEKITLFLGITALYVPVLMMLREMIKHQKMELENMNREEKVRGEV